MGTNSSTVVFSTLHRAAPALGFAVTSRQCRDSLAINGNSLGVVSAVVVEFVCHDI